MHVWTATTRHEFTTKRSAKRLKHTGNISRYWNEINNEINTECLQYLPGKNTNKETNIVVVEYWKTVKQTG